MTAMTKVAGSWTARGTQAIIVMLCWRPRILHRTVAAATKRRDVCATRGDTLVRERWEGL